MKEALIRESKDRLVDLADFLEATRLTLHLKNIELIEESRIGKGAYYHKLKKGLPVNADAYIRLILVIVGKIRKLISLRKLSGRFEIHWAFRLWRVIAGKNRAYPLPVYQ